MTFMNTTSGLSRIPLILSNMYRAPSLHETLLRKQEYRYEYSWIDQRIHCRRHVTRLPDGRPLCVHRSCEGCSLSMLLGLTSVGSSIVGQAVGRRAVESDPCILVCLLMVCLWAIPNLPVPYMHCEYNLDKSCTNIIKLL